MGNVTITETAPQPATEPQPTFKEAAQRHDEASKAAETPEQRGRRERDATRNEVFAISEAYEALHRLDQAALRRAFTWLHDRLEHAGTDPWESDEKPF